MNRKPDFEMNGKRKIKSQKVKFHKKSSQSPVCWEKNEEEIFDQKRKAGKEKKKRGRYLFRHIQYIVFVH